MVLLIFFCLVLFIIFLCFSVYWTGIKRSSNVFFILSIIFLFLIFFFAFIHSLYVDSMIDEFNDSVTFQNYSSHSYIMYDDYVELVIDNELVRIKKSRLNYEVDLNDFENTDLCELVLRKKVLNDVSYWLNVPLFEMNYSQESTEFVVCYKKDN